MALDRTVIDYAETAKAVKESMLYERIADMLGQLINMDFVKDFEELKKEPVYKRQAHKHLLNNGSLLYFDCAMLMRFMKEIIEQKRQHYIEQYTVNDVSFDVISAALEKLIETSLVIVYDDNENLLDYQDVVKRSLEPLRASAKKKAKERWDYAEAHKTNTDANYVSLSNAIVEKAVVDYERALSGAGYGEHSASWVISSVERYAKEQSNEINTIDLNAVLSRIKREYNGKYISLAVDNAYSIKREWDYFSKKNIGREEMLKKAHYKCPVCGNVLRGKKLSGDGYIVECSGCYCFKHVSEKEYAKSKEKAEAEKERKKEGKEK